jgi:MFS family permease
VSKTSSLGSAFNRLWLAFSAAKLGDGLMGAAAPLLAISLTKDPVLVAMSGAMYLLPWLFFAIAIGTLVDRLDRRRTLVFVAIFRGIVATALAFAIATHSLTIYGLLIATFLVGTADVFNDTALQSIIPTILEKDQLERGNARFEMSNTVLQMFIGMPLGAAFFVIAAALPFGLDSLGFVVAAVLLFLIPSHHLENTSPIGNHESFREQMMVGLRYLWNEKKILGLVVATASIGFGFNVATATGVLFLTKTLGVPKAAFGVVLLLEGVGGLSGAFLSHRLSKRLGRGTVLATAITATSAAMFGMGFSPNVWVFIAWSLVIGLAISMWNILLMSTYHTLIPNELFGRVHGTRRTLVWGLMPVGSLVGGLLARINLSLPYMVGGGFAVTVSLIAFGFIRQLGNSSDNT